MMTRKSGAGTAVGNISREGSAPGRRSVLNHLATEEDIAEYLRAVVMDIEEGECEAGFLLDALADIARARAVNQLAKETGIGRRELCRMLDRNTEAPNISHDALVRVAKAFSAAVPA